jgi:hypothetical protein
VPDPVEEAAGRLYGLPLEDFTRERDALAKELRKAKERDAAAAVGKLKKPSQAAWAANALAREHGDLVEALMQAVDDLREAQEAAMAGGGPEALRAATLDQRAAVDALVDAARKLKPGGRAPTAATLERLRNTLNAAATDDEVREALRAGRLVEDAEGGAWGLMGVSTATETDKAPARPRRAAKAPAKAKAPKGESAEERKARQAAEREAREAAEREAREQRRRLEADLKEARAEKRSHERELARAEREAARAADRLQAALTAVEEARSQADEAAEELDTAKDAAQEARDHVARLEEQLD